VRRFSLGDRVYADQFEKTSGFYAEYVAVDQRNASLAPKDLDMLDAGAVPVTGLTALQGIDDHLHVRADETVLIFGATGAVGTLAIQFARRKKARVIATASGNDARRLVKRLGAEGSFDPRAKDAVEQLKRLAPDGIDAALALAGGEVLEQCLGSVRAGGRVAYPNGVEPEPRKRRSFPVLAYDAVSGPREFTRLSKAISEADLEVPIAAVFPLADAAKAHEQLEKGHVLGRIALRVRRGNG
jgi:NADPH:quinone reductase-like Zn-dependent oxidoreductase